MLLRNLKTLISFKTISLIEQPEEFNKLYEFVDQQLSTLNLITREYKKDEYVSKYWGTVDNPDLLLTAHVDVVPADDGMFAAQDEDGKLSGRGALDMKFAIASFIKVFKDLPNLKDFSIGMLLTPDEETGGFNGTKYVLENEELNPKIVILPDGGANMSIEYAEKGIIHARIKATGKSAHGSRPWLGENAIDNLISAYQEIKEKIKNPNAGKWVSTVNAGKIIGGTATNVVPDLASLDLDFRFISETVRMKIIKLLKDLANNPNISTEIIAEGSSFELEKENKYLLAYLDIAEKITGKRPPLIPSAGSSDARFYAERKIPVIINRPLGEGIHSENEWINLKSLEQYTQILIEFCRTFAL